jgi:hypothetical protein
MDHPCRLAEALGWITDPFLEKWSNIKGDQ